MKKLIIPLLALLCMATSCERADVLSDASEQENVKTKNVKFKIGNISVTTDEFESEATSRATLTEAGMTDLFVVDTDGTVLVHQLSTDSDWGTPNIALTYGRHELAFVATKGKDASVANKIFSTTSVKDTFVKYVTLDVSATTLQQSITLERAVAGLRITITDTSSADIATVDITVGSYGKGLSVPTLEGVIEADHVCKTTIPADYFKTAGGSITSYTFVPTLGTEYTTTVKVDFKDAGGNILYTKTVNDVPLLNNQMTNIKGSFFSGSSANVSVNNSWLDEKTITI